MTTKITGDRELPAADVELINRIKETANTVGVLVEEVLHHVYSDHRWAFIARTELQQGFMALVRAVAKSEGF